MGWIRKTPNNRWKASYRDPEGRTISKTWDLKGDADRWLAKQTVSVVEGNYTDPRLGRTRFGEYWERFMATSPKLRPATRDLYTRLGSRYLLSRFAYRPLASITRDDVKTWIASLQQAGVGAATVNASYRLLRTVLGRAVDGELIARNAAAKIPLTELPEFAHDAMRYLSADEVERIADEVPERYKAFVLLLGFCGLRIGEAAGLRAAKVNVLRRRVEIEDTVTEVAGVLRFGPPKTDASRRSVALPRFVADAIADHMAKFPGGGVFEGKAIDLVFTTIEGKPIRRTTFRRRVWVPAVVAAGIGEPLPRVHDLRHSAVAIAIAAGAHPKQIQSQLGHSSIGVTFDRYGHLFESMADELADRIGTMREMSVQAAAASVRPDRVHRVRGLPLPATEHGA